MNFQDLSLKELKQITEDFFVVQAEDAKTKADYQAAFLEADLSIEKVIAEYPQYDKGEKTSKAPVFTDKAPADSEDKVLLKMNRENGTYEVRGYRFTKEHPIVIVAESDADYILETQEGFSMASPREAKEFYK